MKRFWSRLGLGLVILAVVLVTRHQLNHWLEAVSGSASATAHRPQIRIDAGAAGARALFGQCRFRLHVSAIRNTTGSRRAIRWWKPSWVPARFSLSPTYRER